MYPFRKFTSRRKNTRYIFQTTCTYSYLVTKIQQVDVGIMHALHKTETKAKKGENTIRKKHSVLLPFFSNMYTVQKGEHTVTLLRRSISYRRPASPHSVQSVLKCGAVCYIIGEVENFIYLLLVSHRVNHK